MKKKTRARRNKVVESTGAQSLREAYYGKPKHEEEYALAAALIAGVSGDDDLDTMMRRCAKTGEIASLEKHWIDAGWVLGNKLRLGNIDFARRVIDAVEFMQNTKEPVDPIGNWIYMQEIRRVENEGSSVPYTVDQWLDMASTDPDGPDPDRENFYSKFKQYGIPITKKGGRKPKVKKKF